MYIYVYMYNYNIYIYIYMGWPQPAIPHARSPRALSDDEALAPIRTMHIIAVE